MADLDAHENASTLASPLTLESAYSEEPPSYYYEKDIDSERLKQTDAYEILIKHSGIPEQDVLKHVKEQRDKAWKIWPYPCIGKWQFLDCGISSSVAYSEVLERVKNGQMYLEAGCAFGQDLRKLVSDGAPPANLIATDLSDDFWQVGFSLFKDESRLGVRFIAADVTAASSPLTAPPPAGIAGSVDIIHASYYFHLFTRAEQLEVGQRLVGVLRPVPGVLLVGRHVGNRFPDEYVKKSPHKDGKSGKTAFRHNEETWRALWDEIGQRTGSKWEVEYKDFDLEPKWVPFEAKGCIVQFWVVRRVSKESSLAAFLDYEGDNDLILA
ncbi:uncharacterized protein J3D65DRAFT_401685 [Phyllosticta citribraziliensis]|uniref:Methyltransferase domain-containing protein n=1 Tax=Phyllosticta citribraziliensis TaxID=989973 RepID=A0ABR1LMX5_9PEZI